MKLFNKFYILVALFVAVFVTGCAKEEDLSDFSGDGVVLKIAGVEELSGSLGKLASTGKLNEQTIRIPYSKDLSILATLTPVGKLENATNHKLGATTVGELVNKTESFVDGTKFMVLVYDESNNFITQKDYTYSTPSNGSKGSDEIKFENLDTNKKYTFIVYSTNTDKLPAVNNTNYNNATLSGLKDDSQLLYYKSSLFEVKPGKNYLNVKMKHVFSEVSTEIIVDQEGHTLMGEKSFNHQGSVITAITNPRISPAYSQVDFKLSNGTFSAKTSITNGKELIAPAITNDNNQVYKIPTQRIIVEEGASTFEIPSLRINNTTNPVKLSGFDMKPGVRYKLKLQIGCPCTEVVLASSDVSGEGYFGVPWHNSGEMRTTPFTFPASDFGSVLDIYRLDNSFNMVINGEQLMNGKRANKHNPTDSEKIVYNEMQFQGWYLWPTTNYPPNIRFADGSKWGVNGVPEIFDLNDNLEFNRDNNKKFEIVVRNGSNVQSASNYVGEPLPIIKVVINKFGQVTLYGSKNTNGGEPYYPLELTQGDQTLPNMGRNNNTITDGQDQLVWTEGVINDVPWYTTQDNKVSVTQNVNDKTIMVGKVIGHKIKSCSEVINK